MRQILVYGDSVTWGIIPGTRDRLAFAQRWPMVLERRLNAEGATFRVIENCLNGRRTVWDDPFRPGRNGAAGLAEVVELNSPLALVVIALGTNDFQATHDISAWMAGQGVARLIDIVGQAVIEPGLPRPAILVVAPPRIEAPKGENVFKFVGAERRSEGFADVLRRVAETKAAHFFDMNDVTTASEVDGIHLDVDQHERVGEAMVPVARWAMDRR
ncbi:MAG: SGNH/GDSL hydrolase family protein [Phreatobacter sp.]